MYPYSLSPPISLSFSIYTPRLCFSSFDVIFPKINSVIVRSGTNDLDTAGGQQIQISGFSFGECHGKDDFLVKCGNRGSLEWPVALNLDVPCQCLVNHTTLLCNSVRGVGREISWKIRRNDLNVLWGPYSSSVLHYSPPAVLSTLVYIQTQFASDFILSTLGSEEIFISGSNFGHEDFNAVTRELL